MLAAGKDATVLFETYHPRGVPPSLVKKLQIGVMEKGAFKDSFYSWDSEFYKVLKKRVVERLDEKGLSRRGSIEIWIKAIVLLVGFWYSLLQMYLSPAFSVAVAWSISMGIFAAMIGTCIQHDGNHGAFAKSNFINKWAGWTLDMIGASAFTWELQHMLGHHPYTNVLDWEEEDKKEKGIDCPLEEKDQVRYIGLYGYFNLYFVKFVLCAFIPRTHPLTHLTKIISNIAYHTQESDPDVFSSFPLVRMHPLHTPQWFHAYQHIYAPLLFAAMTLAKVFQQDFEVATSQRLYHIDGKCRYGSTWNIVRFWGMKVITMGYMLGFPIYFHGVLKGFGLFFIGHCACGELLATMFIVNHVIEGVSYGKKVSTEGKDGKEEKVVKPTTMYGDTPMDLTLKEATADKNGKNDTPSVHYNDWAAVQCQTSVNWSSGSWFWNHFSGGLSHQIEHHLFPSICHTNYCYINDVVQDTCREYGVPYQNEKNLLVAYGKMLNHLKFLGRGKSE